MSNFIALTRKKGTSDEWKDATWIDGYFGGRRYGVRFENTDEWLDGSEYEIGEVIKLVQYARKYQTELAKQKLLKIIKEREKQWKN